MKHLLLPLLAALALPTAVNAGNLGIADIKENTYGSNSFLENIKETKTFQKIINSRSSLRCN